MEIPFVSSLLVEIRKRMGSSVFAVFQSAIVAALRAGILVGVHQGAGKGFAE